MKRLPFAVRLAAVLAIGLVSTAGAQQLPTPESVLGFEVGADFHLARYDQSIEYFQALDAADDRLQMIEVGRTSFGLPWHVAVISSAENLANLDRNREIAQRLAHPKGLSDAEARSLAREGKAIVHIDGGLHASETAHAQHTIQLAYDLLAGDDDPNDVETSAILDNVILLLWPSINPDGQNMVVDWYNSNLGTPFELSRMPQLYQKYVGHDNNRDGYMINMIESRVATRVAREWEPQILYNHHQTAPNPATIWIPPFAEPISPYVHPLMWRTVNQIGMAMSAGLEERGLPGATHMGTGFDDWYPGFIDHANNFHNVAAFLTETGRHGSATPRFYTIQDRPPRSRDQRPESLSSSPWPGGWWRLADSVEYMLTASMSVLDYAAKYKVDVLYNRYQAGRDVIRMHTQDPPYVFFVRQDQRDPVAAVELLRRLAFNGIEVDQLTQTVDYEGQSYAAGTWAIRMDQEFANFVRQLFAIQDYPDLRQFPEGPPDQPYDVSGWTLQYQMDVDVVEGATPLDDTLRAAMSPVQGTALTWDDAAGGADFDSPPDVGFDSHPVAAGIVPPAGRATGTGAVLALDPAQNNTFKALNRAWAQGGRVAFEPGVAGDEGEPGSAGRYLVSGLGEPEINALVGDLALRAERVRGGGNEMDQPRIGVYRPWAASMDEGWTRWLLESYEFDYSSIYNAEMIAGNLRDRHDVILLVDIGGGGPRGGGILNGSRKGSVPPRYAGGIGVPGVRALEEFVRRGGTLVCLNQSTTFAIEQLHLPVTNVTDGLESTEFFLSGTIVAAEVDPAHPVMSGMPTDAKLFGNQSPVFSTEEGFDGSVFARYADVGTPRLSGYLLGEEHMLGYAAAVDVKHGDGHVILLGFKPQWRGQPFGTFKILFNSLLYSSQVAAAAPDTSAFWSAEEEADEAEEEEEEADEAEEGGQ